MTIDIPAVRLARVEKHFRQVRALDGVDLSIAPGEAVALLGPNGAGKSTLIRILLGLMPPDRGTAELFGARPETAIRAGRVGAMAQDDMFLPSVTVRDFVQLACGLYPRSAPVDDILASTGLTDRAGARLNRLSGGEAKRARFAFALAGDPDLLVLDEPTAALDVAGRQTFWTAMRRYAQRGKAVLFATHYLEEADEYADRIVVIAHGRIIADGTPAEIKKLVSGRTVTFDLAGSSPVGLDRLPGVREVEIRGDRAHLTTDESDELLIALVTSGRRFANLEVVAAGLESAFLTLTAGTPTGTPAPEIEEMAR